MHVLRLMTNRFAALALVATVVASSHAVYASEGFEQPLVPLVQEASCPAPDTRTPTQTVLIPNVIKGFATNLGGGRSWYTTFVVQNTGSVNTTLEVTYYRFPDGQCVLRERVSALAPGTSVAQLPIHDGRLPANTQYSVVVRSFGSPVASIANVHGSDLLQVSEAMSFAGASAGAPNVVLPNIVRRFFGYVTPFLIQNHGSQETVATARFVSFDGSAPSVTVTRAIPAGGSRSVDPNSDDAALGAPGLVDGKQYTVSVTSPQPVSVVVNTHDLTPGLFNPIAYSTNGIAAGAPRVYGPYAAKNAPGTNRVSTIVVQNLAATAITPTLTFTPLEGGSERTFTSPGPVGPSQAWAFDPRFTLGTTVPCTTPSATCLGDGEYSFVASSGAQTDIAAVVNVISRRSGMGYAALREGTDTAHLPNVTRTLGGTSGWTTPILLQSVDATGAVLKWYRFGDGALVHTQTVSIPRGAAVRIDPRDVGQLSDDAQYAVVVAGATGRIVVVVMQLPGYDGDGMIYEGFARSSRSSR